jgi:sugar phosphate isomerase/epimerase
MKAYAPSPDPLDMDVDAMTLDFSHASLSGLNSLEIAKAMGSRLRHVHLCDGATSEADGAVLDEHLLPGEGTQPVAETLQHLAANGWDGNVVAEVSLRKEKDEAVRIARLEQTVAFAREHLSQDHATRVPLDSETNLPLKIRQARRAQKRADRA